MKKIKSFVLLLLVVHIFSSANGQYIWNYQAVYPFDNWNNPTKNYTFTKELNNNGYFLTAVSDINYIPVTALAALKLDNNFNIQWTRSYMYGNCTSNSSITTYDVTATSDGGYIACGVLATCNNYKAAFIVKFSSTAVPQWIMSYPNISVLNSIVEQRGSVSTPVYIACGKQDVTTTSSQGVILKINATGVPVWQRNTSTAGINDKIIFNQIIQASNTALPVNYFAVVGNSNITNTTNIPEEDVILALVDTNGNVTYCYTYGNNSTSTTRNRENGYSITVSENRRFVISGSAGQYNALTTIYEDVLLLEVDPVSGSLTWASRYDALGNNIVEEPGRAVKVSQGFIYVSGYQKGSILNPNQSYDAFLIKTDISGNPIELRIFGDTADDLFYKLEPNIAGDGMVAVGFSNSYNSLLNPAPFIVESYPTIKENCHDKILALKMVKMALKSLKVSLIKPETKYITEKLVEVKNPVSQFVVCKKVASVVTPQLSKDNLTPTNESEIKVYPNPATNSIRLNGLKSTAKYSIVNAVGAQVKSGSVANESSIELTDIEDGIYFIILNDNPQKALKFIKGK